MKKNRQQFDFTPKLLTVIVLAAIGSAHAADEEEDETIAKLTIPDSVVSVGVGAVSGDSADRAVFGQYNGFRKNGTNLLLDAKIEKENKDTGTWLLFDGRNLGLDDRQMKAEYDRQGHYEFDVTYSELVHRDIRTINTGLANAGTTTPTVTALSKTGAGTDLNLDIQRKSALLHMKSWLAPNLLLEADFKDEKKEGARLSGIGLVCSDLTLLSRFPCSATTGAILFMPEPIDSTIKQIDLKLNLSGQNFLLTGGYYGSFYDNAYGSLNPSISGNLLNPNGSVLDTSVAPGSTLAGYLQQPLALSPNNQAHQLYVSGSYAASATTHATFKYSHTHATQDEDFAKMGLTGGPVGVGNLGGVVDSNRVQVGVTARPMDKLSTLADLRYENKWDKTPLANYAMDNTGVAYTNDRYGSNKKLTGKLEASYQMPDNYRATFSVDYATVHRNRPVPTADIPDLALAFSGLRENTREFGYRAELRHSMSETINGSISYLHSRRNGDSWLSLAPGLPALSDTDIYNATGTFPMTMMDRTRDKVKLSMDWIATDDLSLQFMLENGKDKYSAPTEKGLHDNGVTSYGVDAALTLSEHWKMNGYVNRGTQTINLDHASGYIAELENVNTTLGVGFTGKPTGELEVGGDLSYLNDSNRYKESLSSGSAVVGGGLPDVTFKMTKLKLFGKYALQKNSDVRVDLIRQSVKFDEWTWGYNGTSFTYSDNSTVSMQPTQNVTFLGASYSYRFR